jgi:hypothetical protein
MRRVEQDYEMNEKDVKKNPTEQYPMSSAASNPQGGFADIFKGAVDEGSGIDVCFTKIGFCRITLHEASM